MVIQKKATSMNRGFTMSEERTEDATTSDVPVGRTPRVAYRVAAAETPWPRIPGLKNSISEMVEKLRKEKMVDKYFVATCRCGKEREVRWPNGMEGNESYRKLAQMSACKTCEIDFHMQIDSCMETVYSDGGVAGCELPFRHRGRCQPVVTQTEIKEVLGIQDFKLADDE